MRSEGQVRHKLKQVLFRHLQKKIRSALRPRPNTCIHNRVVEGLDIKVAVCGCPKNLGKVCDSRFAGCLEQALVCPHWLPLKDKEVIKAEFRELVGSPVRGVVAAEYPDVAALLWLLDEDITQSVEEAEAEVDGEDENG